MINRQAISFILVGTTLTITAISLALGRQEPSMAELSPNFDYAEQKCPFPELSPLTGEETKQILSPKYGIQFSIPAELTILPGERGIKIIREKIAAHIRCQERLRALGWSVPGRGISTISIYQAEGTPTPERLQEMISQPSPLQIEKRETIQRGKLTGYLGYGDGGAKLALQTPSVDQPVVIYEWCDCSGYNYSGSILEKVVASLQPFSRK
jgi:hypothetical protein